jgi:alpha-tubulin suppressor-like RCC1 family protein
LGNGTYTDGSNVPVAVSTAGVLAGKTVSAVAAGELYSLAVANGQAFAWGLNNIGQLGTGSTTGSNVPVAVSTAGVLNGKTVTAVTAGSYHGMAVANGQAYAWGLNPDGELGNASTTDSNVPVAVSTSGVLAGKTVTAVAAGGYHSLAVANGQVFAWGYNGHGELGNGTTFSSDVPEAVNSSALHSLIVTEVAAGGFSSYALTSTGRLFAWGDNSYGEMGIGSTGGNLMTPREVLAPAGYVWTGVDGNAENEFVVAIATPVPEPGTCSLLAGALAAAALRRLTRGRYASTR